MSEALQNIPTAPGVEFDDSFHVGPLMRFKFCISEQSSPRIVWAASSESIEVEANEREHLHSVARKEGSNILMSAFIVCVGLQTGNPVLVYGGLAIAGLYMLRNYL